MIFDRAGQFVVQLLECVDQTAGRTGVSVSFTQRTELAPIRSQRLIDALLRTGLLLLDTRLYYVGDRRRT